MAEEFGTLQARIKKLEAKNKKLEAENKKLKAQVQAIQAENAELKERRQRDASAIVVLQVKTARAEAEASNLKNLLAHDGPHDPVSKYD